MYRHKGYVLLAMLVFLQLCLLLSCNALRQTAAMTRINHEYMARVEALEAARIAMGHLVNNINASCRIPLAMPNVLMKEPLSWWQQNACTGNSIGYPYYYMIESLGEDECAHAGFYRITVLLQKPRVMLQGTVAVVSHPPKPCLGQVYLMKPGIQSQLVI